MTYSHEQTTALWVGAFFDELVRWGVRDVVVSPGSRSTALAMAAFELNQQRPNDLALYLDVDERGAAFFALGLAKASGRPAVLVCTSGTALANYYPAVIEAETSRVPLIVLSGDRPPQLQGLGAPQTTDQVKAYGDHVRAFRAMPLPAAGARDLAFVRQAAREAVIAAVGGAPDFAHVAPPLCEEAQTCVKAETCVQAGARVEVEEIQVASRGCAALSGPVHFNFPFDEPLKPDFKSTNAFTYACGAEVPIPTLLQTHTTLDDESFRTLKRLIINHRTLIYVGEGTCSTLEEAREVVAWAHKYQLPLIADPLSGLRAVDDELVIDNHDNVFRQSDFPRPELIIRFGRYPISKCATTWVAAAHENCELKMVVVDAGETRDFNFATDVFVAMSPFDFVRSGWHAGRVPEIQQEFAAEWVVRNNAAREQILAIEEAEDANQLEGAYVRKVLELAPEKSLLFSANSMAVRAIDTFYVREDKPLCVLCNRGQNGIDGTTSTALGAAQKFEQTTFITGDFTFLHDISALALQNELLVHHGEAQGKLARSVVIVLLNNNGGAIFDMLPQASDDPYFERLFLVPQNVDFAHAAQAFHIPYERVHAVEDFSRAYEAALGVPGISIVEVQTPLRGVKNRYGSFWG